MFIYFEFVNLKIFYADFDRDGETSDSLVPQNRVELGIPLEQRQPHTPPFEKTTQSRDAAKTGNERGLIILSQQVNISP